MPKQFFSTERALDEYLSQDVRPHDLLNSAGQVVAHNLSEYEMVRELLRVKQASQLFRTGGEEEFEVHFVNENRRTDVECASKFLLRKEEEYAP